jgi:dUTP pyrophosphatase
LCEKTPAALRYSLRRRRYRGRIAVETTTLEVTLLHPAAQAPARSRPGDAGYDLRCVEPFTLAPGERATVPTGVAIAVPEGAAGLVVPRSGLAARHGITIVNAPGLVDSGYRGDVKVVLLNTDPRETFIVEPGMRIAQLVIVAVPELEPVEEGELAETERGGRGYGSSGH